MCVFLCVRLLQWIYTCISIKEANYRLYRISGDQRSKIKCTHCQIQAAALHVTVISDVGVSQMMAGETRRDLSQKRQNYLYGNKKKKSFDFRIVF